MSRRIKPTVLHYTGYGSDGGGIHAIIRALRTAGSFRVVLGVSSGFAQRRSGPRCWRGPSIEGESITPGNFARALRVAWRIRRWLVRGPHRLFHGHSRAGLLVGLWLALLGQRRVLVTVHCFSRHRWFYRICRALLGARLFWLSPAMPLYYGCTATGWSGCLPDCVPESAVRPWQPRGRPRPVVVGCVGGLDPIKGWELVLRALACVPPAVPLRIVHIGATGTSVDRVAYASGLRRLGDKLGLGERWEWRGEESDVAAFYAGIDCLVVASRLEAFSVAALEAIAAGVPVLAPAGSGTTDLISVCAGGWTYEADSTAALAARLISLATGPDLETWRRNDEGLRAFTAPVVADAHTAAYRSLIRP